MENSFQDILDGLVEYRDGVYRSDAHKMAARLEAIEWALQAALEKLRDLHDRK